MHQHTHTCPRCGETKPISEFGKDKSKASGHKSICKPCDRKKHREYYERAGRKKRGHARLEDVPSQASIKPRQCLNCGCKFTPANQNGKYCTRKCSGVARRINPDATVKKMRTSGWQVEIRACEWCEELFVINRESQLSCSTECAKKRRHSRDVNKAHRRRKYIESVTVEPVKVLKVYERDNWTCGLCGESIDKELKWPAPGSVSLDHVIPISKGGEHSMANTQASHLGCNSRKGNRTDVLEGRAGLLS